MNFQELEARDQSAINQEYKLSVTKKSLSKSMIKMVQNQFQVINLPQSEARLWNHSLIQPRMMQTASQFQARVLFQLLLQVAKLGKADVKSEQEASKSLANQLLLNEKAFIHSKNHISQS